MSERFYFRLRNKDDGLKVAEDVPAESGAEAIRLFKAQGIKPNPEIHRVTRINHAAYGWLITRDHLNEDSHHPEDESSEVGIMGPWNISPDFREKFEEYKGFLEKGVTPPYIKGQRTFKMYDDDGILYYTGIILGEVEGDEPLRDFGGPNAGCVLIKYPRYPELTAEY